MIDSIEWPRLVDLGPSPRTINKAASFFSRVSSRSTFFVFKHCAHDTLTLVLEARKVRVQACGGARLTWRKVLKGNKRPLHGISPHQIQDALPCGGCHVSLNSPLRVRRRWCGLRRARARKWNSKRQLLQWKTQEEFVSNLWRSRSMRLALVEVQMCARENAGGRVLSRVP